MIKQYTLQQVHDNATLFNQLAKLTLQGENPAKYIPSSMFRELTLERDSVELQAHRALVYFEDKVPVAWLLAFPVKFIEIPLSLPKLVEKIIRIHTYVHPARTYECVRASCT
jgi:hypothetical protein